MAQFEVLSGEKIMKKILLALLFLISLLFQTSCLGNNETDSNKLNNHQNSTEPFTTENDSVSGEDNLYSENGETTSPIIPDEGGINTQNNISNEEICDFLAHSTWYSYFTDGEGKKLYTLRFYTSSNKMEWKIGNYESEWINTFAGSFDVDKDGVFCGDLYDELRDMKIQIAFTVDIVSMDGDNAEIAFTIIESNLDAYKTLENKPISFALNADPDYPFLTANYIVEQKTSSQNILIHVETDLQLTMKDNILYDGADEEYFKFRVLENSSEDDYFKSMSDEDIQYTEDKDLSGETTSGYLYRVYYSDVEVRKGQIARYYKIFITVDYTVIILIDAYHYKFKDGMSEIGYYEKYIRTVVRSINIEYNLFE